LRQAENGGVCSGDPAAAEKAAGRASSGGVSVGVSVGGR